MFGVADEITWSEESSAAHADDVGENLHSLHPLLVRLVRNGPRQFAFDYEELADLQFAERVHVVRGNHEEESLNRAYSFYDEVCARFNEDDPSGRRGHEMYAKFKRLFMHLPLAVLVGGRVLGMHGGLSPKLRSLAAVRAIRRPIDDFDVGSLECDLVWSDPDTRAPSDGGFRPNLEREALTGIGQLFAADTVRDAAERLGVDLFAPLHGYALFADGRLLTLFSAPGYKGSGPKDVNMGACLEIAADMRVSIKQLQVSVAYRRLRVEEAERAKRSRKHTPRFVEKKTVPL
ncbi:Serine/threonine-protein phosphatase [Aphelenchoides fujianensis]|nr:Serine/threonine-protein phosphatase [Aphelenchoides fujianensis]KAI6218554.1 Serine/threonine-protein phosphatase [Aphelenchoides fujianensis]